MPIVQHLVVDEYGLHIGKKGGRLQVKRLGEGTLSERLVQEAPLMHLESVLVSGKGISLSADAIRACCEEGIPIHFVSRLGRPYAGLYAAALTGTVQTRRAQLAAYDDERSVALAVAFAEAKIHNQAALLTYLARQRRQGSPDQAAGLQAHAGRVRAHIDELDALDGPCVSAIRDRLLSAEGRAARCYWEALKGLIPASYAWPGRERRGARDPINAALNYGYGILYAQIERAAILAGLDPYGGFTHVDRPGKPSLVLDLIEEFRVPAVDRVIIGLANRRTRLEQDEEGLLVRDTRRMLAAKILGRLDKPERYEGKRHPLRAVIQHQARHVATYLRRQRERYRPFTAGW